MERQARFIEVCAEVRYWEDAIVDGQVDAKGQIPLREGDCWRPVIELTAGRVQGWPCGVTASVHYKVCDAGDYWLLDESLRRIAKWRSPYVPKNILCVGTRHSDYIIFSIEADGRVSGWAPAALDAADWMILHQEPADGSLHSAI